MDHDTVIARVHFDGTMGDTRAHYSQGAHGVAIQEGYSSGDKRGDKQLRERESKVSATTLYNPNQRRAREYGAV